MNRLLAYRMLCGSIGIAFSMFGGMLFLSFFGYQQPGSIPTIPTGPVGYYFVAFTGCALIGWGGGLLGAARRPETTPTIGTATALALTLMAIIRIVAWVIGDYYSWLGELPRIEAGFFLLVALGFVWLRPAHTSEAAKDRPSAKSGTRLRLAAAFGIGCLLVLVFMLPSTGIGRRGNETLVRADVADIAGAIGAALPSFSLQRLDGSPLELADLRGHRVLLVFERSVDW